MNDIVINPAGLRQGARVAPSWLLRQAWPERYSLDKRGVIRHVHNYGHEAIQDVEVRWDSEHVYHWYAAELIEAVNE